LVDCIRKKFKRRSPPPLTVDPRDDNDLEQANDQQWIAGDVAIDQVQNEKAAARRHRQPAQEERDAYEETDEDLLLVGVQLALEHVHDHDHERFHDGKLRAETQGQHHQEKEDGPERRHGFDQTQALATRKVCFEARCKGFGRKALQLTFRIDDEGLFAEKLKTG
jgi:hypothetical protein